MSPEVSHHSGFPCRHAAVSRPRRGRHRSAGRVRAGLPRVASRRRRRSSDPAPPLDRRAGLSTSGARAVHRGSSRHRPRCPPAAGRPVTRGRRTSARVPPQWARRSAVRSRTASRTPPTGSPSARNAARRAPSCTTSSRASAVRRRCTVTSMCSAPPSCAVVQVPATRPSTSRNRAPRTDRPRSASSTIRRRSSNASTALSNAGRNRGRRGSVRVGQRSAGHVVQGATALVAERAELRTQPGHHGGQPGQSRPGTDVGGRRRAVGGEVAEHEGLGSLGRGLLRLRTEPHVDRGAAGGASSTAVDRRLAVP